MPKDKDDHLFGKGPYGLTPRESEPTWPGNPVAFNATKEMQQPRKRVVRHDDIDPRGRPSRRAFQRHLRGQTEE